MQVNALRKCDTQTHARISTAVSLATGKKAGPATDGNTREPEGSTAVGSQTDTDQYYVTSLICGSESKNKIKPKLMDTETILRTARAGGWEVGKMGVRKSTGTTFQF